MKFSKVLRRTSLLVMACASLAFISCGPKPGEEEVPEQNDTSKTEYTLSVSEDTVSFDEGDDAKTITVTTNGTVEVEVENETFATASVSDNIVTITPKAAGSTTVIVSCKEDSTKTVDIVVTVNALYPVTLKLASELKSVVNKLYMIYGADNGEYKTVEATYTAGEETGTVSLKTSLANADKWYNGLKYYAEDSDGNRIDLASDTSYFCYTTEATKTINLSKAIAEKTFTINFTGFEAKSVTGLEYYYNAEGSNTIEKSTSVTVTVATDGQSATFTVEKANVNATGWFAVNFGTIEIKNTSDEVVTVTSGAEVKWFDYNVEMSHELKVEDLSGDYTELYNNSITCTDTPVLLIEATSMPSSISAIKIVYTTGTNDIVTKETWLQIISDSKTYDSKTEIIKWGTEVSEKYEAYCTDAKMIAAYIENGIYLAGSAGTYKGTLTVSYK